MTEPARTGTGRRALKIAGIVLGSLVGLLLVALVVLYFYAEPLAERFIKKRIAKQTEGLYQIDMEGLDLSLHNWGITLQEVHLYPDTLAHRRLKESGKASRNLFEMRSPQLEITGISLVDLIFRDRFSARTVVLAQPRITQLLDDRVEEKSRQDSQGDGIKGIRIREIDIKEGSYRYLALGDSESRPIHEVSQLSLEVQDLQLDLQAQQDIAEMVQAEGVELDLRRYTYQAPDSVYAIRVGRFVYSSGKKELKLSSVEVQPDLQANARLPKERAHRSVFQVRVPLLHMQGLDVPEAWQTKQLQLNSLVLERGTLHIQEDLTVPGTESSATMAESYARLSPYLQEMNIDELRLTDGSFRYSQQAGSVHVVHELEKAYVQLQALRLDSVSIFQPKERAFADEVVLAAGRYAYSPTQSPYTLRTGGIRLSSSDKTLEADALHLEGDWNKNDRLKSQNQAKHTFYDIRLPQLRLQDMDLLEALRTAQLSIGSIAFEQPVIDIRTDQRVPKKAEGPDIQQLYRQVSGLVNRLEVGEISVNDAALTQHSKTRGIQRLQNLEHASLVATGLVLDSAFVFNPEEKVPLQDITLLARNYRYRMPDNTYTIDLGSLRYSTRQQEFTARTLDVNSNTKANDRQKRFNNASRKLLDLSATMLRVSGLDLIRAVNTGRIEADQLVLREPEVAILLDRQVKASETGQQEAGKGLFDVVDMVAVNTIRLEDASFTFSEKLQQVMRTHLLEHASATISGFQLTPTSFANLNDTLPMQELTLLATDYTFRSTDSLYTIRLDSLHYSSRQQELVARTFGVSADREVNERLKKEAPAQASRNLIDVSAKRLRIMGFNLVHAYATGQYHMDRLLLAGPEVTILQDHNILVAESKASPAKDTTSGEAIEQVSELVSTLRIGRMEVKDGTFDFDIREDTIRRSHTLAHVALGIDQLRLVSLEASDPLDIFDVDDIEVLVQGYTFHMPDSLYALEIKEISASMQNRLLQIDSLRLRPLFSKEQYKDLFTYARDRVDLTVPAIELQGFSLRALFNDQDLIARRVLIRNPEVEIYRDNSIGLDPAQRPPTLQAMLRDAEIYIRLDTVLVEKMRLEHPVIAINGIRPGVLLLEDSHLQLYNVTNDSALIRQNNIISVNATTQFMGASTLRVRYKFEMGHPRDRYTYEGSLDPMDFTAFNPLFENQMFVRMTRGQIGEASFSIVSNQDEATGRVHFPYNGLRVELLNKEDPENQGFFLKAGTKLVNFLVVKSNNPSTLGNYRKGKVEEERDHQRAVFHHMGQSMLDGIATSLMSKVVERIISTFVDL